MAADADETVEGAVRDVLSKTLGRSAAETLLFYANIYGVATHPEGFSEAIRKLLGKGGDVLLGQMIGEISLRTGVHPSPDFADFIREVVRRRR